MERVILIDETRGDRIDALLNPESLSWRRRAGLRERSLDERPLACPEAVEDALIYTGGGVTEIDLDLLFDTRLLPPRPEIAPAPADAGPRDRDVRDLTRPLWTLTEPQRLDGPSRGFGLRPQLLIWGAWSVRVVVVGIAERFEEFDTEGVPRRAWLSLALRRAEPEAPAPDPAGSTAPAEGANLADQLDRLAHTDVAQGVESALGGRAGDAADALGRPDIAAAATLGDPRLWPLLMEYLGVEDPLAPLDGRIAPADADTATEPS